MEIVPVTQDVIDRAIPRNGGNCPIYIALQESHLAEQLTIYRVGRDHVLIRKQGAKKISRFQFNIKLLDWVLAFDLGEQVEPFDLRVSLARCTLGKK